MLRLEPRRESHIRVWDSGAKAWAGQNKVTHRDTLPLPSCEALGESLSHCFIICKRRDNSYCTWLCGDQAR